MRQIVLISQKLFELDPNKVCQSEALALKRTLNMLLRRVGEDKVILLRELLHWSHESQVKDDRWKTDRGRVYSVLP